jgi:hypothetical protein
MTKNNPPLQFHAAVSSFEAAREALIAFRNQNPKLLEQHDLLVRSYNDALKEVKAIYKQNHETIGPSFGEFKIRISTKVDAKKLIELMPNAEGAIKVEYAVDLDEYKRLVKAGLIPQEVVEQVESPGTVSVYGPKEA